MTDLERFIELYKSFGVELEVAPNPNGNAEQGIVVKRDINTIFHGRGDGCLVVFDMQGKFLRQIFY